MLTRRSYPKLPLPGMLFCAKDCEDAFRVAESAVGGRTLRMAGGALFKLLIGDAGLSEDALISSGLFGPRNCERSSVRRFW
jgi:hypothetical protein